MVRTRPDIAYEVARFSQVTERQYVSQPEDYINELNSVIARLHTSADLGITFPDIDPQTAFLCIYSDARTPRTLITTTSLARLATSHFSSTPQAKPYRWHTARLSQGGLPNLFSPQKPSRLSKHIDVGFCLRHELSRLLRRHVSLTLATDSQTLFNAITRGSSTAERRLLVDLAAVRQGYRAYGRHHPCSLLRQSCRRAHKAHGTVSHHGFASDRSTCNSRSSKDTSRAP
jgi:hypothetical protein